MTSVVVKDPTSWYNPFDQHFLYSLAPKLPSIYPSTMAINITTKSPDEKSSGYLIHVNIAVIRRKTYLISTSVRVFPLRIPHFFKSRKLYGSDQCVHAHAPAIRSLIKARNPVCVNYSLILLRLSPCFFPSLFRHMYRYICIHVAPKETRGETHWPIPAWNAALPFSRKDARESAGFEKISRRRRQVFAFLRSVDLTHTLTFYLFIFCYCRIWVIMKFFILGSMIGDRVTLKKR